MRSFYLRFCERYQAAIRHYLPLLLLACGILTYTGVWSAYHLNVLSHRSQPAEVDDAYTYLWHAARLKECLTSCQALDDLANIVFAPTEDVTLHNTRSRIISRMMTLYTPLPAVGMRLAQDIGGLSPEQSFYGFMAVGLALQIIGLTYLTVVLLGHAAAGVALILLAFTVHTGQGFHYIVPSTVTMTIAFIVWARLLQGGRAAWKSLFAGILILTISHTTGRLYALAAVAIYLLSGSWRLTRREMKVVAIGLVFIFGYWLVARTLKSPAIDVPEGTFIDPTHTPYFTLVAGQVRYLLESLGNSLRGFSSQGAAISLTCLALALLTLPELNQKRLLRLVIPVAGLLGLMTIYVVPAYLNEGLHRMYPIAVILTQTLLAWLVCVSVMALAALLHRAVVRGRLPDLSPSGSGSVQLWLMLGWLFMVANASIAAGSAIVRGVSDIRAVSQYAIDRQNVLMNRSAVDAVLAEIQPGDSILYPHEVTLQYALSYGTYRYGTVFLPILDEVQRGKASDADYLIMGSSLGTRQGLLPLNAIPSLTITVPEPVILSNLRLYFINPASGFDVIMTAETDTYTLNVPAEFEGWLSVAGATQSPVNRLVIQADAAPPGAGIQRVRFSAADITDSLWYPWEQRATFVYRLDERDYDVTLDPAALVPDVQKQVTVLDDNGYVISARLE